MDTTNFKETVATNDENTATIKRSSNPNINEIWKSLDQIFQCTLRQHVLNDDLQKFDVMANELGFSNKQKEFLSESIKNYASFFSRQQTLSPRSSASKRKKSLNKNSNNRNEAVSGRKRRRNNNYSSLSDDDSEDDEALVAPTRKRRKKQKKKKEEYESEEKEDNVNDIDPMDEEELEEGEFLVEAIIGHKKVGERKYKYNIKWLGYDETTWEPPASFGDDVKILDDYWTNKGKHDKDGVMAHFMNGNKESVKIKSHKKKKSDKKKKKKKDKKDKDNKPHDCTICGKSFDSGAALGGHTAAKHPKKNRTSKDLVEYWVESDEDEDRDLVVEE